jgi:hypothetical protein
MRKGILPVLVVSGCLAIAACGGSGTGSTGTTGTSAAAKTAFVKQLNSLCRRANAAYLKAPKQAGKVAAIQRYLALFRKVKAPPELDSSYALYLAVLGKELADLKHGDAAGLAKVRDTQAGPLIRQLGATGCYG